MGWVGRVATCCVVLYAAHALYTIMVVFSAPSCSAPQKCLRPRLRQGVPHDLALFLRSASQPPLVLFRLEAFEYDKPFDRTVEVKVPRDAHKDFYEMYAAIAKSNGRPLDWTRAREEGTLERIPLIEFAPKKAATFNLLGDETKQKTPKKGVKPKLVAHLKSHVYFCALADAALLPAAEIPPELGDRIKRTRDNEYYPVMRYDPLKTRLEHLVEITPDLKAANVTIGYSPASIGKLKFLVHISTAMGSLIQMGFGERDLDDVKGLFADANLYLLCATILISSFHLLFDFLAFKNDVSFWKSKTSMEGLSSRTVVWRAFSQIVVTLYLFDENTSLLVLVPSIIAAFIELWKVKKIFHLDIDWSSGSIPRIRAKSDKISNAEMKTRAVDAEAMRYLCYVLYPLCICGAIYSLFYQPHKSWYSWTLHSTVNGVYAFGFLFMLPQLFINYRLKSVAALPWRAFMYKAFNTFIDDVFAFIITMPIAHRVACFRDDIVFLIYLYQRWLYPVDKSRVDGSYAIEETIDDTHEKKE